MFEQFFIEVIMKLCKCTSLLKELYPWLSFRHPSDEQQSSGLIDWNHLPLVLVCTFPEGTDFFYWV